MVHRVSILVSSAILAFSARDAAAQVRSFTAPGRGAGGELEIPKAYLPPPGMCRIWLDSVPPAQQPAPTDCATAIRRKPKNARLIFADETPRKDSAVRVPAPKDTIKAKKP